MIFAEIDINGTLYACPEYNGEKYTSCYRTTGGPYYYPADGAENDNFTITPAAYDDDGAPVEFTIE